MRATKGAHDWIRTVVSQVWLESWAGFYFRSRPTPLRPWGQWRECWYRRGWPWIHAHFWLSTPAKCCLVEGATGGGSTSICLRLSSLFILQICTYYNVVHTHRNLCLEVLLESCAFKAEITKGTSSELRTKRKTNFLERVAKLWIRWVIWMEGRGQDSGWYSGRLSNPDTVPCPLQLSGILSKGRKTWTLKSVLGWNGNLDFSGSRSLHGRAFSRNSVIEFR